MEETQKIFEPTPVDRDATLVTEPDGTLATPRFDEVEAQVARPVVPFADNGGGSRHAKSRRRQWPIALVLISALAGGVVSLFAFRLYQQQSKVAATGTGNGQTTNAAPIPEPTPVADTAATVTQEQAQAETPLIIEEVEPVKEGVELSDADPRRQAEADAKPAVERRDERRDEAKPTPAAPRVVEARPRRVENSSRPAPRQVEVRHEDVRRDDDRTDEDIIAERRERRRERREQRREQQQQRRAPKRNIDRIKDIFEGAPPA